MEQVVSTFTSSPRQIVVSDPISEIEGYDSLLDNPVFSVETSRSTGTSFKSSNITVRKIIMSSFGKILDKSDEDEAIWLRYNKWAPWVLDLDEVETQEYLKSVKAFINIDRYLPSSMVSKVTPEGDITPIGGRLQVIGNDLANSDFINQTDMNREMIEFFSFFRILPSSGPEEIQNYIAKVIEKRSFYRIWRDPETRVPQYSISRGRDKGIPYDSIRALLAISKNDNTALNQSVFASTSLRSYLKESSVTLDKATKTLGDPVLISKILLEDSRMGKDTLSLLEFYCPFPVNTILSKTDEKNFYMSMTITKEGKMKLELDCTVWSREDEVDLGKFSSSENLSLIDLERASKEIKGKTFRLLQTWQLAKYPKDLLDSIVQNSIVQSDLNVSYTDWTSLTDTIIGGIQGSIPQESYLGKFPSVNLISMKMDTGYNPVKSKSSTFGSHSKITVDVEGDVYYYNYDLTTTELVLDSKKSGISEFMRLQLSPQDQPDLVDIHFTDETPTLPSPPSAGLFY